MWEIFHCCPLLISMIISLQLKDDQIARELERILSSDDDDEDDETVADSTLILLSDLDTKLNKIQSYSQKELISILSDHDHEENLSNVEYMSSHMSDQPMLPPTLAEDITLEVAPDQPMLPLLPAEEPIPTAPEADFMSLSVPVNQTRERTLPIPEPMASTSGHNNLIYNQLQNKKREWSDDCSSFTVQNFDALMTVNKIYNNRSTPLTYFQDMFPTELIDLLVTNTNIYAAYNNSKHWKDTTFEEVNAYLGLVILMSINPISDIKLYWSTDEFYKNTVISGVMPFKRFQKITENIHVSNILEELPRTDPNFDKLVKVRPIIETLNVTFQQNCSPSQHNSIDESMIKFKGKSTMKQYMPKKPIKRGYKCWCRCDSKTGYLYQFQFYTGKVATSNEEGLGCRVVTDLCQNLPEYTLVAFDNFFTSLPLLEILYSKKIYAVGTIRIDRKGLPVEISKTNKELKLKCGEFLFKYWHPIACFKWRDTKDVCVAATAFDPKSVEVIKRTQKDGTKKEMFCPTAIKKYTDYMGGVDLFDHYRSSYPVGRKSRKYWHRIFWFLLEAAVVNSYIVYHQKSGMTHKDFRLRLSRLLINNFTSKKINTPMFKNKKGGIYGVPNEIRLLNVGVHVPQDNLKFRRCRFCSTRSKEKRSRFICKTCKVPICPECFDNFHK